MTACRLEAAGPMESSPFWPSAGQLREVFRRRGLLPFDFLVPRRWKDRPEGDGRKAEGMKIVKGRLYSV
jgi:hypothetical protein